MFTCLCSTHHSTCEVFGEDCLQNHPLYQVGPWNQTQVIRLRSRCPYQLSHLIGPVTNLFCGGPDSTCFRLLVVTASVAGPPLSHGSEKGKDGKTLRDPWRPHSAVCRPPQCRLDRACSSQGMTCSSVPRHTMPGAPNCILT